MDGPNARFFLKQRLLQIFQVALTLGVLYWLFRDEARREMMLRALRGASGWWLAAGFFLALLSEVLTMVRWRIFLLAQKIEAGFLKVGRWFFIGLFFNLFLPGTTGGDLARLYYLWKEFPEKRQAGFLTLLADRLIGMIPLILAATLATLLNYRWLTQTAASSGLLLGTLIFCVCMAVLLGLLFFYSGRAEVPRWMPWRYDLARATTAWGLFTKNKTRFCAALLLSFPVLLAYYGAFYCAARAVEAGAGLFQIFSVMPIVTIVSALPISVAGLGVREGLFEKLLGDLCGTPAEVAILVSLLGFLMYAFCSVIGAVVYLFSPRMDRQQLQEMDQGPQ